MDRSEFDFIDFGASQGGSIEYAVKHLGGKKGIGIDNDPNKVRKMVESGFDCLQGDVLNLDYPANSFRFVTMMHFLEHLEDVYAAKKAIKIAKRLAKDFIYVRGPSFENEDFLTTLGLKYYWADWTGHPFHLTLDTMIEILAENGLTHYSIMKIGSIKNSDHYAIHPLSSPKDQHGFDPSMHPEKALVTFDKEVFIEWITLIKLRDFDGWKTVKNKLQKFYKSSMFFEREY